LPRAWPYRRFPSNRARRVGNEGKSLESLAGGLRAGEIERGLKRRIKRISRIGSPGKLREGLKLVVVHAAAGVVIRIGGDRRPETFQRSRSELQVAADEAVRSVDRSG